MQDLGYYIFIIIAICVGFLIVKRVTTCLLKCVIAAIVIAIIILLYYMSA